MADEAHRIAHIRAINLARFEEEEELHRRRSRRRQRRRNTVEFGDIVHASRRLARSVGHLINRIRSPTRPETSPLRSILLNGPNSMNRASSRPISPDKRTRFKSKASIRYLEEEEEEENSRKRSFSAPSDFPMQTRKRSEDVSVDVEQHPAPKNDPLPGPSSAANAPGPSSATSAPGPSSAANAPGPSSAANSPGSASVPSANNLAPEPAPAPESHPLQEQPAARNAHPPQGSPPNPPVVNFSFRIGDLPSNGNNEPGPHPDPALENNMTSPPPPNNPNDDISPEQLPPSFFRRLGSCSWWSQLTRRQKIAWIVCLVAILMVFIYIVCKFKLQLISKLLCCF